MSVNECIERERPPGVMADFEARLAASAGQRNALEGEMVAQVAEALREGLWAGHGIHTPEQWLCLKLGISRSTAVKVRRLAGRADELPTTMAMLREGRLSLDQAATVARYTPAEYEASVADLAQHATVAQITRATSKYCFDLDQQERDARAAERGEQRGPRRQVTFGTTSSDEWAMRAILPAEEGAVVEEALKDQRAKLHDVARERAKALAAAEGRPTTGTDRELGVEQPGWADALLGVAKVAARTDRDGDSVADRTGVLIHLKAPDTEPGQGSDPEAAARWRAEMHQGPTLPGPLRRYLTCDCDISTVWYQNGAPVQVGRASRNIPRRIRRLLLHRDLTCRVPGCTRHLWLEIHHIVHWEDDGLTITINLITLCSQHHRAHHMGLLHIEGNADATTGPDVVRFTTPDGTEISPAPTVIPPDPNDRSWRPDVSPYRCPTGERLDTGQVHFAHQNIRWRPRTGPPNPQP